MNAIDKLQENCLQNMLFLGTEKVGTLELLHRIWSSHILLLAFKGCKTLWILEIDRDSKCL